MEAVADIAEKYAFDEIRVSHEQNLILPHVARADLKAVYDALVEIGLATANSNLITDIIACPGLDYCALANARSIPVAQEISRRFASLERQRDIGELKLKISGCINACGHHHVGHIGILGVEKKGAELYQVTLGGSGDENTSIGEIIGRGFGPEEITDAIETDRRDLSRHPARTESKNSSTPIAASAPRRSRRRSMLAKPRPLDLEAEALGRSGEPRRALWSSAARGDHRARVREIISRRNRRRVVVRRGFGRAAAYDRRDRPVAAGHLPRHRQAFRGDARLSRCAGRRFRPDRHPRDHAR